MKFGKILSVYPNNKSLNNLILAIFAVLLVIVMGVVGYMSFIGLDMVDALYFTIITLSSVGYGDIHPETLEAKVFTIFFVLLGVSVFLYALSVLLAMFFEGKIIEVFRMEHVKEKMSKLQGHTILCGYGDVGKIILREMSDIVVVDQDEGKILKLLSKGIFAISGDSTQSETLLDARVDKAKSIVIALDSDPDVLFSILTAKDLNPDIRVYARANHKDSISKMKRAGADYVVCLPELGGKELIKALEKMESKSTSA